MLRKGEDPFARGIYSNPETDLGFTRVSRGELRENPALAARIVANNIVGLRSSVEVPRKFLGYFRYAQNFLILVVRHSLPIDLVRFLLGQWTKSPYSLWLRRAVFLRSYLRKVPISLAMQGRLWLTTLEQSRAARDGSCTPTSDFSYESDSWGDSDLD